MPILRGSTRPAVTLPVFNGNVSRLTFSTPKAAPCNSSYFSYILCVCGLASFFGVIFGLVIRWLCRAPQRVSVVPVPDKDCVLPQDVLRPVSRSGVTVDVDKFSCLTWHQDIEDADASCNADIFHNNKFSTVSSRDFVVSGLTSSIHALRLALSSRHHAFFVHTFRALRPFYSFSWSPGSMRILTTQNAGGNSENSEALSFELLHRLYGAELIKTEMEIEYSVRSKLTDYTVHLGGQPLGVSVSRAMKYPTPDRFSPGDALTLLCKKLNGVLVSNRGVSSRDRWERQILHLWVQTPGAAGILERTFQALPRELVQDTIVVCTIAPNDRWLF